MEVTLVFVEAFERHRLRGDGADHTRRHRVAGLHLIKGDNVLDNFVLVLVEFSRLFGNVGKSPDFLAGNGGVAVFGGDMLLEPLHGDDDGVEAEDEQAYRPRGEPH